VAHRIEEAAHCAPAGAAFLIDLELADAEVIAAVEVFGHRNARFRGSFGETVKDVPAQALLLDPPLAAAAMVLAAAAPVVLDALEVR